MIKELENQIRDLRGKSAEIQKEQAVLRLQACRGDSEIKAKDAKYHELDERAKEIRDALRDLTRKHQLLISQSATKGSYEYPGSSHS